MSTENKEIEHLKRTLAATETNYAKCGSNLIDSKQEIETLKGWRKEAEIKLVEAGTAIGTQSEEIIALKQALTRIKNHATLPREVEKEIQQLLK